MISNPVEIELPQSLLASWQEIVDLLAALNEIPAALIMRFSRPEIEVFLASQSEGNPYRPGDREKLDNSGLYCERVIKTREKLLVPDAPSDPEWAGNPDIKLGMISYLGYPLLLPDGKPFGTICILDREPNKYTPAVHRLMEKFRALIESNLGMAYLNQVLGDQNRRLIDYLRELQALRGLVTICSHCKSIQDNRGNWHRIEHYLIKHPEADFSHGLCPDCLEKHYGKYADDA